MSREPRGVTGHKFVASTEPYAKNQPQLGATSSAVGVAAVQVQQQQQVAATASNGVLQTLRSLKGLEAILNKRVKPLPPDANVSAVPEGTKLYQLSTHVYFTCGKCRRMNIRSDLLAAASQPAASSGDASADVFTCSRCFTKMIRPKNFAPTRLVPFPSLLSWLNYQKPSLMDTLSTASTAAAQRPAEAVVPTGDRLATGLAVNGFGATDVRALPSTAMVHEISGDDVYGQEALKALGMLHPCFRLWGNGRCTHGTLCVFAKAPFKQAIEYLMGIATREQCLAEGLVVDDVFNLPHKSDLCPSTPAALGCVPTLSSSLSANVAMTHPSTSPAAIHDPATSLGQWYARRQKTLNQPEWQLFHNGPIEDIIRKYIVFPDEEKVEEAAERGGDQSNVDNDNLYFEEATHTSATAPTTVSGAPPPPAADTSVSTLELEEARVEALMNEDDDDDDLGALLDNL